MGRANTFGRHAEALQAARRVDGLPFPRMSGDVKEVAATRTNIARLLESRNKDMVLPF